MRIVPVVLAVAASSACVDDLCPSVDALPVDGVLAIGDSVLAWNAGRCQSVVDHAALARGTGITSAAVNGARVLGDAKGKRAIPDQYTAGDWDWVVIDGGGNDLNGTCACKSCAGVLDAIVSDDGTSGAMVDLVNQASADGARVLLVGYYPLPEGAWYGFDACDADLATLDARYATLARGRDDVVFFDFGDVVTPDTSPDAYDFDKVHPAPGGAKAIGTALAPLLAP